MGIRIILERTSWHRVACVLELLRNGCGQLRHLHDNPLLCNKERCNLTQPFKRDHYYLEYAGRHILVRWPILPFVPVCIRD